MTTIPNTVDSIYYDGNSIPTIQTTSMSPEPEPTPQPSTSSPIELLQTVSCTAQSELVLSNFVDYTKYYKYVLEFKNITFTEQAARLQVIYGYKNEGQQIWSTSSAEYYDNTDDFIGATVRSNSNLGTKGFFGIGNDNSSYRYANSPLTGKFEIYFNENTTTAIQGSCDLLYIRNTGGSISVAWSRSSLYFLNSIHKNIDSLKIFTNTGTLSIESLKIYGYKI